MHKDHEKFNPALIGSLSSQYYELEGQITRLDGEVDQNFLLISNQGVRFVIKVSPPKTDPQVISFQISLLRHLAKKKVQLDFPEVVPCCDGRFFVSLDHGRTLRIYTWVSGKMVEDVNPRNRNLLRSWGATAGKLSAFLADFDHPKAHRFYPWDPSETLKGRSHLHLMNNKERAFATYFWDFFEAKALPKLAGLRKSVNFNDAHGHNLLIKNGPPFEEVSGVIDFGDALYTHTINELAIACAYAMMHLPDPLEGARHVVSGFHAEFKLEEKELVVLFPMICARLMLTVSMAAHNRSKEPDNPYLSVSEKPAWNLLRKLRSISPRLAHIHFRAACGLEAFPSHATYQRWLTQQNVHPVMKRQGRMIKQLDLSIGSLDLGLERNYFGIVPFQKKINEMLGDDRHNLGVGGYGEARPFYTTDAYRVEGNYGPKWRTIHLGLDIWDRAGSSVYAPLDGVVHSVTDNEGERNYGPTIILKHAVDEHFHFFTLFGHLSRSSLRGIEEGQSIKAGQEIAAIGDHPENGNWPPHLHFQVILDMLDFVGDFPGVAFPDERNIWLSISPDPTPYFFFEKTAAVSWTHDEIAQARHVLLGHNLSLSYEDPLHIVRGSMQYLFNADGRRYLDTVNNVPHVGHQHPRVVHAAQRQIAILNTNTRYLHQNIVAYAQDLLSTLPRELSVIYFVNSGSEANELAMRMAKNYSKSEEMMAVQVGYHGNTQNCISISSYKFDGKGGRGAPSTTHIVPMPDPFRGEFRGALAGLQYAEQVRQKISEMHLAGLHPAGFICESIMSCGGQIVLPDQYLKAVYQFVRAAGGLCIADEVQVGFGRVGEAFWGFELQEVCPDIVTMGKPMGNGHPLAAVVTTKAVAEAFNNGMEYFNTFGGNPVSCCIGHEVLKVIREEKLQENAQEVGQYLMHQLKMLQRKYPIIGDVRGKGLFMGIELVRDAHTLQPADKEATYLVNRMKERGILMSTDGPHHNVLKIKPPLCFTEQDADFLLETLALVLDEDCLQISDD